MYNYSNITIYPGGYYGGSCYRYVFRITASGGSWEARAYYPRNIHRHGGTVDKGRRKNINSVKISDL